MAFKPSFVCLSEVLKLLGTQGGSWSYSYGHCGNIWSEPTLANLFVFSLLFLLLKTGREGEGISWRSVYTLPFPRKTHRGWGASGVAKEASGKTFVCALTCKGPGWLPHPHLVLLSAEGYIKFHPWYFILNLTLVCLLAYLYFLKTNLILEKQQGGSGFPGQQRGRTTEYSGTERERWREL